ncbi:MAG: hypothetical protein R2764_03205 [Bacteroidales bacterium]
MDTRIGYPNEHLSNEVADELASPMYATGIGLVIEGMKRYCNENNFEKEAVKEEINKEVDQPEEENESNSDEKPLSFLKKIQDFFEKDGIS